jgi:chitinase
MQKILAAFFSMSSLFATHHVHHQHNQETSSLNEAVIAGYYENWSQYRPGLGGRPVFMPNLIDPSILSRSIDPTNPHLTGNFDVQPVEWNDQSVLYVQVQALKNINPHLRTHLSIGGWSFNDPNDPNGMGQYTYKLFSQMVSDPTSRTQFINSAISYAHQYGFNGIDIDWEYPGDLTRGGQDSDFDHFVEFLKEFYGACKNTTPQLHLTCATAAIVPTGVSQKYHDDKTLYYKWLASCSTYLDWLNVMCYDYHGAFDNPQLTGVNAPLNRDTNPASQLYDAKTLSNYLENGVPTKKIVLGMPIYGHSYGGVTGMTDADNGPGHPFTTAGPAGPSTSQPGFLAYFEIADMISLKELIFASDVTTSTAYGFNLSTKEWVSFDTPDTIALKANLIKSYNLLGGMFWAIDNDEYWWDKYPNIKSAYNILKN